MRLVNRGIVPIGRTAVSKTDGCEFESCYPCHIKKKPSISSAFSHLEFGRLSLMIYVPLPSLPLLLHY